MRLATRITLVTMVLVACGPERRRDAEGEATAVGTVVQDSGPSARYRLRTTYDGPPVLEATNRIIFYITRQASTSQARARLDIRLVEGSNTLTGASGDLPPANTEPNLVDLAWTSWCVEPPCDASADITIDLLPATGAVNPAVEIGTITATSNITYETEDPNQSGTVGVTLTQI